MLEEPTPPLPTIHPISAQIGRARGWNVAGTVRSAARTRLHEVATFDLLFVNVGITNNPPEIIGAASTELVRVMLTNALRSDARG